jgi:hypothetical protein
MVAAALFDAGNFTTGHAIFIDCKDSRRSKLLIAMDFRIQHTRVVRGL